MKKNLFKKGDLVKHKHFPKWGVGKVIDINAYEVKVRWLEAISIKDMEGWWFVSKNFDFAENPIQRMKRLYSEDV